MYDSFSLTTRYLRFLSILMCLFCFYISVIVYGSFSLTTLYLRFLSILMYLFCFSYISVFVFGRFNLTGPHSAVCNVSDYRCVSDCRCRGCKFHPIPYWYWHGDWSWNNFYGHLPPSLIHSRRVVVSFNATMFTKYWLTACWNLPMKKVWLRELTIQKWPQLLHRT